MEAKARARITSQWVVLHTFIYDRSAFEKVRPVWADFIKGLASLQLQPSMTHWLIAYIVSIKKSSYGNS